MVRQSYKIVALLLVTATSAQAQTQGLVTPASPPCSGPEYRTLDFWVGDWIAEWDVGGKRGAGTNRITRDEYGSCVITEHFRTDDGKMIGHSVSIYRPQLKQWRQTWVDSQGSYFDLVGAPVEGAPHKFYFENKRVTEKQAFQRMVWEDVTPDSFVWKWQRRAKPEEAWTDSWVIHYRRKTNASGQ